MTSTPFPTDLIAMERRVADSRAVTTHGATRDERHE
jgi:hypothetical protein